MHNSLGGGIVLAGFWRGGAWLGYAGVIGVMDFVGDISQVYRVLFLHTAVCADH